MAGIANADLAKVLEARVDGRARPAGDGPDRLLKYCFEEEISAPKRVSYPLPALKKRL